MATARADAWQESSLRYERPPAADRRRPPPPLPPLPPLAGRSHPGERDRLVAERPGTRAPRRPIEPSRPSGRSRSREHDRYDDGRYDEDRYDEDRYDDDDHWAEERHDDRYARQPEGRGSKNRRPDDQRKRGAAPAPAADGRLRGIVAVLGIFVVTLGAGFVDSFMGAGLGMVTLIALVTSTAIATLTVRRRDVVTVVIAPPLVFAAVVGLNIALAPSLTLSLPTVATLLIRGFPTIAVATAGAIVLALVRLVSRR